MVEKVLELNREKTIFWTLLGVLFLCSGFYMYFINSTIRNIVERQNLEAEASKLTLIIGSDEFKYISMRNEVTLDLAYSLGFKDVTAKRFISRNANSQVSYISH